MSTAACSCRRSVQVVTAAATVTGDEIFQRKRLGLRQAADVRELSSAAADAAADTDATVVGRTCES